MLTPITSPEDPRIAPYRDVKDRDLHRRDNLFIVEGKVTVTRLIEQSRFEIVSLFLADTRLDPMAPALAKLDPAIPAYTAPQDIMDDIAGFPLHRGVLALARRNPGPTPEQLLATLQPQTLLVLIGLSNHDNVGACFRNAAALGADAILLDETSCDPLYRKSIRVSAGTALSLPFAHTGAGADIIATLKAANYECWSLTPTNGTPIHTIAASPKRALILGPEGPGLTDKLMDQTTRITIPMASGVDSLNVATAGAIALSHIASGRLP
jgi:tRNA G18 (ribose-2'-O)-methylase SpoU